MRSAFVLFTALGSASASSLRASLARRPIIGASCKTYAPKQCYGANGESVNYWCDDLSACATCDECYTLGVNGCVAGITCQDDQAENSGGGNSATAPQKCASMMTAGCEQIGVDKWYPGRTTCPQADSGIWQQACQSATFTNDTCFTLTLADGSTSPDLCTQDEFDEFIMSLTQSAPQPQQTEDIARNAATEQANPEQSPLWDSKIGADCHTWSPEICYGANGEEILYWCGKDQHCVTFTKPESDDNSTSFTCDDADSVFPSVLGGVCTDQDNGAAMFFPSMYSCALATSDADALSEYCLRQDCSSDADCEGPSGFGSMGRTCNGGQCTITVSNNFDIVSPSCVAAAAANPEAQFVCTDKVSVTSYAFCALNVGQNGENSYQIQC